MKLFYATLCCLLLVNSSDASMIFFQENWKKIGICTVIGTAACYLSYKYFSQPTITQLKTKCYVSPKNYKGITSLEVSGDVMCSLEHKHDANPFFMVKITADEHKIESISPRGTKNKLTIATGTTNATIELDSKADKPITEFIARGNAQLKLKLEDTLQDITLSAYDNARIEILEALDFNDVVINSYNNSTLYAPLVSWKKSQINRYGGTIQFGDSVLP